MLRGCPGSPLHPGWCKYSLYMHRLCNFTAYDGEVLVNPGSQRFPGHIFYRNLIKIGDMFRRGGIDFPFRFVMIDIKPGCHPSMFLSDAVLFCIGILFFHLA